MKALRQKFGIDEKFTHVEKGLPEEVIRTSPSICRRGSRCWNGRTYRPVGGVPRHTAEQVVDDLRRDLPVLKPEAYQMRWELDDDDDD